MASSNGLNGHEFEQAPGDGEGQGRLACCSPWGHKESDTTEQQTTIYIHETITTIKTIDIFMTSPIFL